MPQLRPRCVAAFVLAAALVLPSTAGAAPATDVAIESGVVRGAQAGDVLAWKGVPFAAPPVGADRWRAPRPAPRWSGIRETVAYGHDCMQTVMPGPTPLQTTPAEDCLYLNVWTPARATAGAKLPVAIWIYGGGFMWGGSSIAITDGARFARDGVILVSFNYRVGRLGFFAHPALTAAGEGPTGNFGYMDMIAALNWVQHNIAAFGGDRENVTVFGESAGGAAVNMILTSPVARGLFKRALVMSGGGLSPTGLPMRRLDRDQPSLPSAETVGVNFARSVGIEGAGPQALARLRALPAEQIVANVSMSDLFVANPRATYTGGPVNDGVIASDAPLALVAKGQTVSTPVMIGSTSADVGGSSARTMEEVFASFGDRAAAARKSYDPDGTGQVHAVGAAVAMDRMMTAPARMIARAVSGAGAGAYFYRFSYVAAAARAGAPGALHASDVPYVFDTVDVRYGDKTSAADKAVAGAFHAYLVNFARNGDPNGPGLPRWKPFTEAPGEVLDFDADGRIGQKPDPWKARLDVSEPVAAH